MNNDNTKLVPSLSDKIALVSGGARGIGAEVYCQLAALGAYVVVAARDLIKAEGAAAALRNEGLRASGIEFDVTSESDRLKVSDWLHMSRGRLDILINNAGVWLDSANAATLPDKAPSETSACIVRETFKTNLFCANLRYPDVAAASQALGGRTRRQPIKHSRVAYASLRPNVTGLSDQGARL